jgi:carbon monoxide dehydrogenase subunit G
MQFNGQVSIQAPRLRVWEFLIDPQAVSQCAPGLESLQVLEPGKRFQVVAAVGFGTVRVKFVTEVEFTELAPPERASMRAHGTAPGSAADVLAQMALSDAPNGATLLDWTADVTISGTITSLASRLMGSVTKKVTGAFFECVREKIEA